MTMSFKRDISVLWVAESNWITGSGIKPHEHEYYHMFMVRQGPLEFEVDGELYRLDKGESMLAPPGVVHGLCDVTVRMGRVYEVKFAAQSPAVKQMLETLPPVLPAAPLSENLVQELVEESARQEVSTPTVVADYLRALIGFFSRHYGRQEAQGTRVVDTTGFSGVSVEIVRYLEEHYAREIPLQEVADQVGFNKNYICSVFKRDSGMTIGNCQTAIRIRKAAEMISFSDMNLAQVAAATGFSNLSHFNRIFKKVAGIPPGQYRRMFTADMLVGRNDEESTRELLSQNGFIVSVLGRKRLPISEIVELTDLPDGGETK